MKQKLQWKEREFGFHGSDGQMDPKEGFGQICCITGRIHPWDVGCFFCVKKLHVFHIKNQTQSE